MLEKSILFVDDEEMILKGLRRMLHGYSKEWKMYFALGGEEALTVLKGKSVDVLVTDMKMPGMSGVGLMESVRKMYPKMIRIVLSGHSERDDVIRAASLAHQYLAKPCKPERLISVINQSYYMATILKDDDVKRVVSTIDSLPTLPATYNRLVEELNSEDPSLKKIGEIVSTDIGLSATILKQVNSAFWGLANHVKSPEQAVNLLGSEVIKALALSNHMFKSFATEDNVLLSLKELEKSCLLTARFAKEIIIKLGGEKQIVDNAFIAGLLLDIGKLILLSSFPDTYKVVVDTWKVREGERIRNVETEVMGVTHAEIGAYLLGIWGMPKAIIDAVALHHSPLVLLEENDLIVSTVYLASFFCENLMENGDIELDDLKPNSLYLQSLGLLDRYPEMFQVCQDIYKEVTDE
jgi:HD-like signal output (HDOD) protein/CheY-like chemotaxis protein